MQAVPPELCDRAVLMGVFDGGLGFAVEELGSESNSTTWKSCVPYKPQFSHEQNEETVFLGV